jgi:hypothetical protein
MGAGHQFKFGFDIATIHVISNDRVTETFTFSNLTNYLNGVNRTINPATGTTNWYTQWVRAFGNNVADHNTDSISLYAQDAFQVSPKLSSVMVFARFCHDFQFTAFYTLGWVTATCSIPQHRDHDRYGNSFPSAEQTGRTDPW